MIEIEETFAKQYLEFLIKQETDLENKIFRSEERFKKNKENLEKELEIILKNQKKLNEKINGEKK